MDLASIPHLSLMPQQEIVDLHHRVKEALSSSRFLADGLMAAEARLHKLRARLADAHLWARRVLHQLGGVDGAEAAGGDAWAAWRSRTALGGDGAGGDADSLDEVCAHRLRRRGASGAARPVKGCCKGRRC